jgi:hypothetical protein
MFRMDFHIVEFRQVRDCRAAAAGYPIRLNFSRLLMHLRW